MTDIEEPRVSKAYDLLFKALMAGDFKKAQWVKDVYEPDEEDIDEAFVRACLYGELKAARWLNSVFDLEVDSVERALWGACRYGKLDMVKWLFKAFDIEESAQSDELVLDVRPDDLILETCKARQFEIVKFLVDRLYAEAE